MNTLSIKTVDGNTVLNPLYQRQKEDVCKMRTSLLACTDVNGGSTRQALQNITAMRVYHQLMRIIRYTELMDKLEDKLYSCIDSAIDSASSSDPTTWMMLLNIQEKLQKSMIESHKLLQPYLDIKEFTVVELAPDDIDTAKSDSLLSPEERDSVRSKAQSLMLELKNLDAGGDSDG